MTSCVVIKCICSSLRFRIIKHIKSLIEVKILCEILQYQVTNQRGAIGHIILVTGCYHTLSYRDRDISAMYNLLALMFTERFICSSCTVSTTQLVFSSETNCSPWIQIKYKCMSVHLLQEYPDVSTHTMLSSNIHYDVLQHRYHASFLRYFELKNHPQK